MMISPDQHGAGSLAGRVGRVWRVRCLFREVTGWAETSIDFISGHVMETALRLGGGPGGSACFQQIERAYHVCVNEIAGTGNGTVHVRFSGEVHYMSYAVFLNHCEHIGLV